MINYMCVLFGKSMSLVLQMWSKIIPNTSEMVLLLVFPLFVFQYVVFISYLVHALLILYLIIDMRTS